MPGQETLFRTIRKLEPGHSLLMHDGRVQIRRFWDLEFPEEPRNGSFEAASNELVELLRGTVRDHLLSDVPVGILLSGGVDSTAMLSLVAEQAEQDVKSFTIGFEGERFDDERPYAKLAAARYGNKHYEMTIKAEDFRSFLPKYVWHMEEPVCEPPAVALYYVTKLAREHVKVLISGEGGDEAFAGYQNYRNLVWFERLKAIGQPWRSIAGAALAGLSHVPALRNLANYTGLMELPLRDFYYSRTSGPFRSFNFLRSELYTPNFLAEVNPETSLHFLRECFDTVADQPILNQMLYVDTKTWLPDDLLIKADKITMANSVELRVPLLDHKILEFAAHLPTNYKVRNFTTKYILKKAFNGRIPKEILDRKKTGFPIPVESWLKKDLKGFVWEILMDRRTSQRGYFQRKTLERLLTGNGKLQENHTAEVFTLLTLELWHRQFVDNRN